MFVSVVNQQATAVEDGLATRFTLPENPLMLVTVITVCRSEAEGIDCDVGFSEIAKSPGLVIVTVTVVECVRPPLVPVIVTV